VTALSLVIGGSLAVSVLAIVQLHDQVARLESVICAHQRADREIDREIAAAGHIAVAIPASGPGSCP
jgi:poly(3-hydroxyalkanoate) synthetase